MTKSSQEQSVLCELDLASSGVSARVVREETPWWAGVAWCSTLVLSIKVHTGIGMRRSHVDVYLPLNLYSDNREQHIS